MAVLTAWGDAESWEIFPRKAGSFVHKTGWLGGHTPRQQLHTCTQIPTCESSNTEHTTHTMKRGYVNAHAGRHVHIRKQTQ